MPTGYTSQIAEGQKFRDFVLGCARAFGACITIRDDPPGTPIPEEFKPDPYYTRRVDDARAELSRWLDMPMAEADRMLKQVVAETRAENADRESKHLTALANLNAMMQMVEQWKPPTPEHEELKKFMRDQITETIRFDCGSGPYQVKVPSMNAVEFREQRILAASEALERAKKDLADEQERCRERTEWVKALRESLAKEES